MKALSCTAAVLLAALFSQSAAASCYVVYGPDKEIVYRASEPPVDMSRNIHETLPLVAPRSTLVFSPDFNGCESHINLVPLAAAPGMRPALADRG